jgi:monovalent cation/hydrogen antiporter
MAPVHVLELVLLLLAAAVVLALAARRLHVPPAAAFVLGGIVLALTPGPPQVELDPELTLFLFLPPLLHSSAWVTVWRDFRANLRPILLLAIGAVAFTTASVGWLLKELAPQLPWAACFTFGAIVSPPDAVSAGAILQRLRIPRRLLTVLEGESLVNDASALVLYRVASAAALTGSFELGHAALRFLWLAAGGLGVGVLIGRAMMWLSRRVDDANLEITVSFLAAWASYLAAERIGASGVLSTVACGLVVGIRQHAVVSSRTRVAARATWEFVTFVLEALVFILIGLSLRGVLDRLDAGELAKLLPLAGMMVVAVTLVRFVWVFPATYLPRLLPAVRRHDPFPRPALPVVVSWAGMRGVVSLAVALALPEHFPGHDIILFLTFSVILATLLLQGSTLGPLIRVLHLARRPRPDDVPPEVHARLELERAKLASVEGRLQDELIGAIANDIVQEFRDRAGWADRIHQGGAAALAERAGRLSLRLEAIEAARRRLLELHRIGEIHDEVLDTLEQELDLDELRLRGQLGRQR